MGLKSVGCTLAINISSLTGLVFKDGKEADPLRKKYLLWQLW